MKSKIYKFALSIFGILPLKKLTCLLLRNFKMKKYFYKDLKFFGFFNVKTINHKRFKLYHWKSTIENEVFWYGLGKTWEPETLSIWQKLCMNSNVILDIGANTGIYSLIAKTINPAAKVFAFEPSDIVFYKLEKNVTANKFDINCINKGVSNKTGSFVFYDVVGDHQTSASLDPNKLKYLSSFKGQIREYNINTITIHEIVESFNLKNIDLVKIDVELHEAEVLAGFGKYLYAYAPIIVVEILTDEVISKIKQTIDLSFYNIYYLLEDGSVVPTLELKPLDCYNYLFVPKIKSIESIIKTK